MGGYTAVIYLKVVENNFYMHEHTLLISVVQDYYRCLNCGGDIEQRVNGKISYLPIDLSIHEIEKDGQT